MHKLNKYIEENINTYRIDSLGYADLENHDPENELTILAKENCVFLDDVLKYHINDSDALQVDLVKAIHGDSKSTLRFFSEFKKAMKSYLEDHMDYLGREGYLEHWERNYAREYAKSAAVESEIESRMAEDL